MSHLLVYNYCIASSENNYFAHSTLAYHDVHSCRFDECVEGGETILLDSYPVLEELRTSYPKHFDTLSSVPVTFQRLSRNA